MITRFGWKRPTIDNIVIELNRFFLIFSYFTNLLENCLKFLKMNCRWMYAIRKFIICKWAVINYKIFLLNQKNVFQKEKEHASLFSYYNCSLDTRTHALRRESKIFLLNYWRKKKDFFCKVLKLYAVTKAISFFRQVNIIYYIHSDLM